MMHFETQEARLAYLKGGYKEIVPEKKKKKKTKEKEEK